MMTIAVNVLVDWIEHKVKGNRYDAQRWTRKEEMQEKEKHTKRCDYRGEKRMKWKVKKKSPLPDAECPFFFRVCGEQGPLQTTTVVLSAQ